MAARYICSAKFVACPARPSNGRFICLQLGDPAEKIGKLKEVRGNL
jgi:hypothetical protein